MLVGSLCHVAAHLAGPLAAELHAERLRVCSDIEKFVPLDMHDGEACAERLVQRWNDTRDHAEVVVMFDYALGGGDGYGRKVEYAAGA